MIRSGSIPPVRCSEGRAASQRGLALLVVLWIIASATLLVSAFGVTARSGASLASSEIEMTKVEALLDAGAEIAATHLIDDREDLRWRADGRPRSVAFAWALPTSKSPTGSCSISTPMSASNSTTCARPPWW